MTTFLTNMIGLFALLLTTNINAQCTLTANIDTEAEVLACLTTCGCNQIIIPSPLALDMSGSWDLTSKGVINLKIEHGASLIFGDNGSVSEVLKMAAGSHLTIINTPTVNNTALVQTGGGGQVRIIIGSTSYKGNDFASLIGAGGISPVLPIDLVSFKVKASTDVSEKANELTWVTSREINNRGFYVERRKLLTSEWDVLGFLQSVSIPSTYSFTDKTPLSMSYYRLRQLSLDGNESYSKVISVITKLSKDKLKVYPNPIGPEGYLNIETTGDIESITLTNTLGQVLLTTKEPKISIVQLPKGMYNVTLKTSTATLTDKFFKF